MDLENYYKPSFTTDDIETVTNIFGYEFFKKLIDEVDEKGCEDALPESGKRKWPNEKSC